MNEENMNYGQAPTPDQQIPVAQPVPEQTAYQQPVYDQSAYQQPAYDQYAYQQPVYDQSAYQQPTYEQPAEPAPAPQAPKKGPKIVKFCVTLVVLIGLAIASIFLLWGFNGGLVGGGEADAPLTQEDKERNEFIDSLGGVSETFEGVLSHNSYYSPEEAAQAFVTEELVGNGYAYVQQVNSQGELSEKEIKNLNLPDYIEYDTIEKVEVIYELEEGSYYSVRGTAKKAAADSEKKVVVYVIKYGVDWKYFAPLPENGNTINKSYYDSVFNSDRYSNCTLETETSMTAHIEAEGETMDMEQTLKQFVQYAEGRIYMEQTITLKTTGYEEGEESETICLYIEEDGYGGYDCYYKAGENGSWLNVPLYMVGFSNIEELTPFYDQYLDYTYFQKADFGFKLSDDNARKYFRDAIMQALGSMGSLIDINNMELDMYAEYYVQEGALSGMRMDANVDMTLGVSGQTGTLQESVTTITKCYDYGTTNIERPYVD